MKEISFKQKIILMFLGIFLSVVVLEAGLRLAGWIYLSRQDYSDAVKFRRKVKDEYRILCLGDSTTAFGGKGFLSGSDGEYSQSGGIRAQVYRD